MSHATEPGGASFTRNSPEEHGADKVNEGRLHVERQFWQCDHLKSNYACNSPPIFRTFNLSQSYRVPPHQSNVIYDFDVSSKFVLPVFRHGKRKANFCALNHMDVILWWCFTTSCLIILKKTLEKCYSITHLRKCFAKSLKQSPLLRFLVIIKATHCVHSGGWSLALSCEPLALVSSIELQWIYQMLIYLSFTWAYITSGNVIYTVHNHLESIC